MKDVNKMIVIGRLGATPIQRQTKSGTAVVHFSVATARRVQEGTPENPKYREETQWHRIVVWGKQGETCAQYLKKGNLVYVEGSIRSHNYEDKAGLTRLSFELHAETVNFLSGGIRSEEATPAHSFTQEAS